MVTTSQTIVFGGAELVGFIIVARIWLKRWHKNIWVRLIWSAVLLVPVLGVIAYFFLRENPDVHPYDTDTMQGAAESYAESSGDHH